MAEEELPEVKTNESWGSRHGQAYDAANGEDYEPMDWDDDDHARG